MCKVGLDETCLQDDDDDDVSEQNSQTYDEVLLHRLKTSLSGVPPPPALTYPQQNIDDILNSMKITQTSNSGDPSHAATTAAAVPTCFSFSREKIEEILTYWKNWQSSNGWICETECEKKESNCFMDETSLGKNSAKCNNCAFSNMLRRGFAEIDRCAFYDVSYNIGELSEKIVPLYDKYRERYVGCETSSFVTANSPSKYFGKKKEIRKIVGKSPGRRILSQKTRRKFFTSSSLQAVSNSNSLFGLQRRTILIPKDPTKKEKDKQAKRALFTSPEERKNMKLDLLKRSPSRLKSIEMRRSLWMRRKLSKNSTPSKQTPKKQRLTPSKQTPKKSGSASKATPRKRLTPGKSTPKKHVTPRKFRTVSKTLSEDTFSLKDGLNENGKRRRSECESNCNTSATSLCNTSSVASDNSRLENDILELSTSQRRKLLWAVSEALKQVGVGTTHKNFRACGRKLYKTCKSIWTNCTTNRNLKNGISDRMLSLASEHVRSIITEVQEAITGTIDLCSQDSNSCDFSLRINDIVDEC